jgi:hypothetical protein
MKPDSCLSLHVVRGNGNHEMWWGVVKVEEFVDLGNPPKRISTLELIPWNLNEVQEILCCSM